MSTEHLEILVEEPSMEVCLRELLPKLVGETVSFQVYPSQCKEEQLDQLLIRLRGYTSWLLPTWRIVVVVDQDDDECQELKRKLEETAARAGLKTRTVAGDPTWQLVNRIAIEELEAWFLGDMEAIRAAYPRIPPTAEHKARFRNPDNIRGGTWEALERLLQQAGYFKGGLRKIEVARQISPHLNPQRNRSHSFQVFREAIQESVAA